MLLFFSILKINFLLPSLFILSSQWKMISSFCCQWNQPLLLLEEIMVQMLKFLNNGGICSVKWRNIVHNLHTGQGCICIYGSCQLLILHPNKCKLPAFVHCHADTSGLSKRIVISYQGSGFPIDAAMGFTNAYPQTMCEHSRPPFFCWWIMLIVYYVLHILCNKICKTH